MTNDALKPLLNQRVKVVNEPNLGTYQGRLVGFRPGKFALGELVILNPDGSTKVASKSDRTRWFSTGRCRVEAFPETADERKAAEKQRLARLTSEFVAGIIEEHHPEVADGEELEFLAAFYTPEAAQDARQVLGAVDEYLCG